MDEEDPIFEYESESLLTLNSSEDEREWYEFFQFNEAARFGEVYFELEMEFATIESFKTALKDHVIYEGRKIRYIKNDQRRLKSYQIKTYISQHTCAREFGSNMADKKWVANKLEKKLRTQPHITLSKAYEHIKVDYNVVINGKMVYRALKEARERVIGSERAQYSKLRDYLCEIHMSNPGSSAILDSLPLFNKLYISLDACKRGFKAGCRKLIGLDGCFLKGCFRGQLLSAIGQDANNHFYVIAFAVVDSETKESWKWFLTLLQEDLGDQYIHGWNFISDQQKIGAALATYQHCIQPVNSEEYWEKTDYLNPIPPKLKRPVGRPVKRRRKDQSEKEASRTDNNKVTKIFRVMCSKCGETGHNFKTCKGPPAATTRKLTNPNKRITKVGVNSGTPNPTSIRDPYLSVSTPSAAEGLFYTVVEHPLPTQAATNSPDFVTNVVSERITKYSHCAASPINTVPNTLCQVARNYGASNPPSTRAKQPIIRPHHLATIHSSTPPSIPPPGTTYGVSAETVAAASKGTASRMFQFIPNPACLRPLPLDPPCLPPQRLHEEVLPLLVAIAAEIGFTMELMITQFQQ
ncbi:hypothetical protein Ahy_B06g084389 [Arachis hypogaea]|uniref:CCHC-type domain-containing protein n=1 Tax=Arachis hypogaea TaxID=3818 RepID=A0A444YRR7_ARAHY|nr:hypothetical protein Ahy_B06g084389 [Arachis hypogaea]